MAITTINESDLIKDSRTVINSNFTELDTLKAPLASPALTGAPTAPTPNPGDDSTKLATTEYVQEEIRTHANLPVGFEYFSPNPNIPQGSLPLFGGEYSRATYADLWAWVQEQSGYLKTEAEWQTLSTANNGNVPYYSSGDGSTTFRVPSLRCWVKGANGTVTEVGSYLAAGLPNITGKMGPFLNNVISGGSSYTQGVFTISATGSTMDDTSRPNPPKNLYGFNFDASRSSSIYGNSTTVQPESIVGMWLVKAYGTVVDTGTIDEQQYIDDRIATCLPLTGGTMLGAIHYNGTNNRSFGFDLTNNYTNMDIGWNWTNRDGAGIGLRSTDDVGSTAGSFSIYARDGTNEGTLNGKPNGSLQWNGKEVVTKKDETISFTMTTSNGNANSLSAHKIGNIVVVNFAITPSSNVGVGSSITGTFRGLPQNVGSKSINSASYVGATALIFSGNYLNYTIRITGSALSSGSGFGMSFMYATVS